MADPLEQFLERHGPNDRLETVDLIGHDYGVSFDADNNGLRYDLLSVDFTSLNLDDTWEGNREEAARQEIKRESQSYGSDIPAKESSTLEQVLEIVTTYLLHDYYVESRIANETLSEDERDSLSKEILRVVPLVVACEHKKIDLVVNLLQPLGRDREPMWPPRAVANFALDICQLVKECQVEQRPSIYNSPKPWLTAYLAAIDHKIGQHVSKYSEKFRETFEGQIYQDELFEMEMLRAVRLIYSMGADGDTDSLAFQTRIAVLAALKGFPVKQLPAIINALTQEMVRLFADGSLEKHLNDRAKEIVVHPVASPSAQFEMTRAAIPSDHQEILPGSNMPASSRSFALHFENGDQTQQSVSALSAPSRFLHDGSSASTFGQTPTRTVRSATVGSRQRQWRVEAKVKTVGRDGRTFKLWTIPDTVQRPESHTVDTYIRGMPSGGDVCAQFQSKTAMRAIFKYDDGKGWIDVTDEFNRPHISSAVLYHPAYAQAGDEVRVLTWTGTADAEPTYNKWNTYSGKFGKKGRKSMGVPMDIDLM